ncbi:MAG: hypothetical protein ACYC3L_01225 [Gemmatimonadaceae bacterium]
MAPALVAEKTRRAHAAWAALFGPVEYPRFAKRVTPLWKTDVPLRAFERAAAAYRRAHLDRATALEWFVSDFQRWRRLGDACPLDEWPGYASAACIADPDAYRRDYLTHLHADDLAAEPQETTPRVAAALIQSSLPF